MPRSLQSCTLLIYLQFPEVDNLIFGTPCDLFQNPSIVYALMSKNLAYFSFQIEQTASAKNYFDNKQNKLGVFFIFFFFLRVWLNKCFFKMLVVLVFGSPDKCNSF